MKFKLISVIFSFIILSSVFPDTYSWELKDAVKRAMSENLVLKQKKIDLDQKRSAADKSWFLLMPNLSAGISMNKDFSPDPWSVSGRIGVSLDLGGALPYQFKSLKYLLDKEIISYEQSKQIYIRDIRDLFYQILLIKERISLAKENLILLEKQYDKTSLLYESGLASDLNLMSVKVNLANTRPEILLLENDYSSKIFQLKYLTGLKADDTLILDGRIILPELTHSLEELYGMVPDTLDLQKLRQDNLIFENDRKIAGIQNWNPEISLGYDYSPKLNLPLEEGFLASNTWEGYGSMTISMSLPMNSLFPWSTYRTNIESIDVKTEKNELAIDQLLYTFNMDLSNQINHLKGIRQTLEARILAVDFSREAYEYTVSSYDNGGVDLQELQSSEADLQKSKVTVLTETYNYISAVLDLEYLLGIELIKE